MKKTIFLFFAAILCSMSISAAIPSKLYLDASGWGYSDARYAAYFMPQNSFVDMTKATGEVSVFEVAVPASQTKVIFVRMNGATTENNWNSGTKWNQTGDLTIPTDGKNKFKPSGWDGATTTWSTYTYTPPTFYIAGDFVTPTWSENAAANKMDYADGVFSKSYDNVAASPHQFKITNGTWTNAIGYNENTCSGTNCTVENGGGNIQFTPLAEGTVTITYTLADGKVHITCPEPPAAEFNITYPATQTNYTLVAGPAKAQAATEVSFTATPAEGYVLNVTYNGNAITGNNNVYAFMMPAADVTIAIEAVAATTLYYVDHNSWGNANAYMWNDSGNNGWPGAAMALVGTVGDNAYSYYSISFAQGAYTNIIFNGGGSQTADLTIDPATPYFYDGEWYTWDELLAKLAAPVVTYDYYVIGTVNSWALKDANFGMTDDNADGVYEKEVTLAAGNNELKVNNGTWDDGCHWGFGNLSAKYEGVEEGKDGEGNPNGNIKITLATQQTIIVKYDKNTSKVTLDGLTESTAPTKYYVVGTFTDNWANAHADYELTLDEDVYKKSLTLNAGEHMFKITNGTWDDNATWGYGNITGSYVEIDEGTNNEGEKNGNIKVTLAAQKTFTVIFDATAGKITFEGLTVSTAPTKYYVKGSHNNWTADATSEMTLDEDVYKKEVTLAKDVEFKINDGADAWWGKDNLGGKSYNELEGLEGGNLKMKEAKTFTIIFNPAEDLITFDGLTEETPVVEDLSKQPSVIYIKCDDWKVDNARYAAYFYGTDETWVNMTDADKDGVYEVVNNKKNRHVIFCRMNPASNENKWDNCWNQSADLGIPTTTYLNYWTVTSTDNVWEKPSGKWMMLIGSGDNSEALAAANEQTVADVYVNRSFTANQLYTIALPFDLNVAPTKTHFGADVKVIKFEKLNKETNGDLVLLFAEALGMAAGKPYVITPSVSVDGFVVNDVVIKNTVNNITQTTTGASVTMEAVLSASKNAKTNGKYWLASNTYLYNTSAALKSLRAVFDITTQSNMPPRVRIAQSENVETGLDNNQLPISNIQKLIENGQLIIIRDGVKYNVQGQVIR